MNSSSRLFLVLCLLVGLSLVAAVMSQPTAVADNLPPRPTLVPTVAPSTPVIGGAIHLRVNGPTAGLWTVVQWQDGLGGWHDVTGWRGEFVPQGYVHWWVAPPDLATGPFRWQIFTAEDGDMAAVSAPFYLPETNGQTLVIYAELP